MRRIRFVVGQKLLFEGVPITLERSDGEGQDVTWEVEDHIRRRRRHVRQVEFDRAVSKGTLRDNSDGPVPVRRYVGVRAISDLPDLAQRRILFERELLRAVERSGVTRTKSKGGSSSGGSRTEFESVLIRLSAELGTKHFGKPKSVGVSRYYQLVAKHGAARDTDDFAGGYDRRGHREQLGPGVRRLLIATIESAVAEYKGKADKRGAKLLDRREIDKRIVVAIDAARIEQPDVELRIPSDSTVRRIIRNDIDRYDWDVATRGRGLADAAVRRSGRTERPCEFPLQWCHFDETNCPIYLYDTRTGIPLGRPTVAWIVDLYADVIVGFYVGFAPPSDQVIAQTLRHACLPKTYIEELYPDLGQFLPAGIPQFLTFDNSNQAHGNSIQQICGDLDIEYDFTRPRAPWFKSAVERMFKRLGDDLLRHQPGYVFPPFWKIPKSDYDPQKTASMDFDLFLRLFHAWIVNRVHARPRDKRPPPDVRWLEGTARVAPSFVADTANLDSLFGIVREGRRLDERGVSYSGLRYYSDALHSQRYRRGATQKVRVKCNPLDIRRIHVQAADGSWIPAETNEHPEWRRLDLHVLGLLNRQARERYGAESLETRTRALLDLEQAVAAGYQDGMSVANATRVSRIVGLGTPLLLERQGHDGRLAPPEPKSSVASARAGLPGPIDTPSADVDDRDTRSIIPDFDDEDVA